MSRKTPAAQATPTLREISTRVDERHAENQRRFDAVEQSLSEIRDDLRLLLDSRQFARGLWKMAGIVAGSVATVVSLTLAWLRGH